jgi:ATPase subunit of ABC transporter with duplicated ATPase domains
MAPDDRIGITGSNGSGKTSLISWLVSNLNLPSDAVLYLPQEIDARSSGEILTRVRNLSREDLGHVMTIVSRLGSRPQRLLETVEPSPGELRKTLLALGIIQAPQLVILDEPTNHLDLPAIECLENALDECPCGLLLVSHDFRFLRKLTRKRWDICDGNLIISDNWK